MNLEQITRQPGRIVASLLVLLVFAAHVGKWYEWGFIHRLETFAYDARLLLTMPETRDERIVIVDIDEKSLAEEGRWPWSRNRMALLVDQLLERYRVGLVAFDVVFAEPEETSGLEVLEALSGSALGDDPRFIAERERLRPMLDRDAAFARSIEGRPVVLGYFFSGVDESGEASRVGQLPAPAFVAGQFAGRNILFASAVGYAANLPVLQEASQGAGHLISLPDLDGLVRRVPMIYEFDGDYYEALSVTVARHVLGVERVVAGFPPESRAGRGYSGLEWLEVGDLRIPVDEQVRALVPFRGRQGSYPYLSATDVMHGRADPALLADKVVLVGTTAKGLLDLRATPVQADFPGVEVHANLLAGILDGRIMENPPYALGGEFVLLMLSGLLMTLLLPVLSPLASMLVTLALLAGIIGVNLLIWHQWNFVFPLATGVLAVVSLFMFNMSYGYFFEQRGKRQLASRFGQYVPPELVDEMSDHPEAFSMESEAREMTVLFSDVRGFTTISEGLEARELSALMNEFLTPLTRVIHQHRGTIDKYMGDAIMAFWGAPLADSEHARHALEAAMDMIATTDSLREEFTRRGWPEIRIGVGLNTGVMSVGNMGSEFRMAYTVLGDAVNLGSRLEGLTKQYGVHLVASETIRNAVPDYLYRELDRVRVKGKDEPVTIYEPLGPADAVERAVRDELKVYQQGLRLYRAQNWDVAEIQFLNLQRQRPDRLIYAMYLERIARFRSEPPGEGWDGVYTHQTK